MLLFLELDVCLMTLFMLLDNYGLYLAYEEPKEDSQGAYQGEWNLDFCRYGMQSRQESLLHLDIFISSIPRKEIPYVVIG